MLIIIDMQKEFSASEQALPSVIKEIKKARRNKEPVVIVQYEGDGTTMYRVTRELKGYKYLVVTKSTDDGGGDIIKALSAVSNNLNSSNTYNLSRVKSIKVCGVNTSACVIKTVKTLSYLRIPIKVLSSACNNDISDSTHTPRQHHLSSLRRMKTWKNVEVV